MWQFFVAAAAIGKEAYRQDKIERSVKEPLKTDYETLLKTLNDKHFKQLSGIDENEWIKDYFLKLSILMKSAQNSEINMAMAESFKQFEPYVDELFEWVNELERNKTVESGILAIAWSKHLETLRGLLHAFKHFKWKLEVEVERKRKEKNGVIAVLVIGAILITIMIICLVTLLPY